MSGDHLTSAFLRRSRFLCAGLVLDLEDAAIAAVVATIRNADALRSIAMARGLKARYVVVAGRLHRRTGGAFTAIVPGGVADAVGAVCMAARAAHARLGELGETNSMWLVVGGQAIREPVLAALADVSATEGVA